MTPTSRGWYERRDTCSSAQIRRPDGVLIDSELDARIVALDEAVTAFSNAINRWDQGGKLVVPDTSFFINHPTKVEDTDFSQLLECREIPVRLVVPMVVVDELDSLKKAGTGT